jgi:uncharacterized protein involved in exopolysaccharide biosynthesis
MEELMAGRERGEPRRHEAPDRLGGEISLIDVAIAMLVHRRLLLALPLLLFALVAIFGLLAPRTYTAQGTFLPQQSGGGGQSGLLNLAAQFGVAMPVGSSEESPAFYAELLTSPAILRQVVTGTDYEVMQETGVVRGDLTRVFDVTDSDNDLRLERTVEEVGRKVSVRRNRETGTVTVLVTTYWPDASHQIAAALIEAINQFNLESRRTQAREEREFIAARLEEMHAEQQSAEDALVQFLNANRILDAPRLHFERDRLASTVAMRRQMTTSLSQALEQARIDEIRSTPVVTVIDAPRRPARPDGRGLVRRGFLALVFGFMAAAGIAFFMERARRAEQHELVARVRLQQLRQETVADLRRPWRLLKPRRTQQPA